MLAAYAGLVFGPLFTVNDDRDVIQAAMLSFFRPENWYAADWKPQTHVVLSPQYLQAEKESYQTQLEWIRTDIESSFRMIRSNAKKVNKKEQARLDAYVAHVESGQQAVKAAKEGGDTGPRYLPKLPVPVPQMKWDAKIVVSDKSNRLSRWLKESDRDRTLEEKTVYATVSRPQYSKNGNFAIIEMSIRWSIHSSKVTMLCQRAPKGWIKTFSTGIFFV